MRKFDLSLRSSRSSYFATFRHQLTILSKTDALDEEKWLNIAIAGGIASALAGGAMSKLFGGGQKAASGGIQGDVLATDNNTVGMGDAGIKSAIQGSNVPNPDEAVP